MSTNIEHLKSGLDRIKVIMFELLDNSRITIHQPPPRKPHFLDNYYETPRRANRRTTYIWIKDNSERELGLQAKIHKEYTTWFALFMQSIDRSLSVLRRSEINQTNKFILGWISKGDNAPSSISESKPMFESKIKLFYDILSISSNTLNKDILNNISDDTMLTPKTSNDIDSKVTYDTLSDILAKLKKMSKKPVEALKKDKLEICLERLMNVAIKVFKENPDDYDVLKEPTNYYNKLKSIRNYYSYPRLSINNDSGIDHEDISKVIAVAESMRDELKSINTSILIGVEKDEIEKLFQYLNSTLREAVLKKPDKEKEIQDVIQQLLVAQGYKKRIDYDREVGRVAVSIKEVIPDFIFPKLDLALEVKLSKSLDDSKRIVDQINADITAYSKKYSQLLFLVYDLGTIRDEKEYKNGIDNGVNIHVTIIKH